MDIEKLMYPIGRFEFGRSYNVVDIKNLIASLDSLPSKLIEIRPKFTDKLLNKTYRTGGWNAKQIFHHLADSNMIGYFRTKFALTEDNPEIKPYDEKKWAETPEAGIKEVDFSIEIITHLQKKWTHIWKSMKPADFERTFFHPGVDFKVTLKEHLDLYAWHGNHHFAHLNLILKG